MTTKQEARESYSKFITDNMQLNIELIKVYKLHKDNPRYSAIIKALDKEITHFAGLLLERQNDMSVENIHKINDQQQKTIAAYNILLATVSPNRYSR